MVVCQYFLQGRCHFGPNCRNEHIYNNGAGGRGGRQSGNNQLDNIVWQISNEVTAAEKGGQWPLSSFAPIKEGSCLPWWEDISPEEVRWTLYEAQKNGTVNQALNQISQWYKKAENARNLLKQPTSEVINVLNDILKGKKSAQSNTTTTGNFSSSVNDPKTNFRFDTSISNIFGQPTTPGSNTGSIFGGSTSPFQHIFGQSSAPLPSNNTSSIFSRPQPSQNIFSSPSSGHNIFLGQNSNQVFPNANSTAQNIFQNQSATNVFSTPSPAFGVANPVVDNSKTGSDIFGNAQQSNSFQFQNPNPPQRIEANSTKAENPSLSEVTAFGKEVDFSVYSKVEDLNENEINAFNSTTFTFGNIPLKPPPQQFC